MDELCHRDGYIEGRRADLKKKKGSKAASMQDCRFFLKLSESIISKLHNKFTGRVYCGCDLCD